MKTGLIGCGKMGRALILGAIDSGTLAAEDVLVCSRTPASMLALAEERKVVPSTLEEVITTCDAILLCTKPADIETVLKKFTVHGSTTDKKLIISVAAGVTNATMENIVSDYARVIRAMPNTPSLVGKGAAAFALGCDATTQDAEFAASLFSSIGKAVEVPEKLMDPVTGLSGSGPAFVYLFIEALADGAVSCGLPRDKALELASQTVLGAATMVQETGIHPGELKDMVTSPGGTTIAGVTALEAANFRSAAIKAVQAATNRSLELGQS